jgi:hypothetical protein
MAKFIEPDLDVIGALINKINEMEEKIDRLQSLEFVTIVLKDTAGDPATGYTGQILINTNDNKIKIWGWAGWRQVFP